MQGKRLPRLRPPLLDLRFAESLEEASQCFPNVGPVFSRGPQIAHDPAPRPLNHLLTNLKQSLVTEFLKRMGLGNQPVQLGIRPESQRMLQHRQPQMMPRP